ncbi:MAG: PD-(D/E)XK nuclease family transposase [Ruminococcus sp.]|nr:PD-(D/E)XK nuclease family transposase [Ruminococcus sp.]
MAESQESKKYDALAKSLLAHKEVIANILKYVVKEFEDCSIEKIISCLNGNPEIASEQVDDDYPPKMDSAGSETVSESDGTRTYDIKFKVRLLDSSDEAELIINIEAQHKSNTGYILEKRGIYYLSRLISSQYNVEFTKSDFNKLKKVYSIWICTNSPKKTANTITRYNFKPEYMVGEIPDCPERYDLMSLVMINLGESDENYDGLIKMLDTLLNKYIDDRDKALTILENEYSIPFKSINKEVDSMCNLSQGIYDKGKAEGAIEGKIQGKIEMIKAMLEEGTTLETALRIAKIDKETYEKYNSES